MSKISVIVPVYNVEQYLSQCLDSIINQTYKNLEIICINDGSSDNSGKILDEYAQKDSRIKVIHQKNQGVSNTRNNGIDVATGEYISFIDADDWIEKEYYQILMNAAKIYNADVVQCGYISFKNSSYEKIIWKETVATSFLDIVDAFKRGFVVNKIWKTELLQRNSLRFNSNIHYCEDLLFSINAADFIKIFYNMEYSGYYYRYNEVSATKNKNNIKRNHDNRYEVCKVVLNIFSNKNKKELNKIKAFLVSQLFSPLILKDRTVFNKAKKILGFNIPLIKNRFKAIRRSFFRLSFRRKELIIMGYTFHFK